ncbi:MAG: SpoVG family protein [Clostridia bacterium]|nr:SpoVG family protein [Clostridia bacterium]
MLNITEVRIKKINKGDLLAAASICIDGSFIVREIKLLNGKNGRYISMPKRKVKNRNFSQDFSYPLNNETRLQLLEVISEQYDNIVEE